MKEFSLKVDKEDALMRLDLYLLKNAQEKDFAITRAQIKKAILRGDVTLNAILLKPSYKIKAGDLLKVKSLAQAPEEDLIPLDMPLEIVYQDKDVALINKPTGLVVHPGAGTGQDTLVNVLLWHFKELSTVNPKRPGIVHRLDKDTSGIMLIAKNNKAHITLTRQFSKHTIKRQYIALVRGSMEFDEDVIELPLARHPRERKKMAVGFGKNAKYARTQYRTIIRQKDASLIELTPSTGRTHQLRVHLAFIGHPILGDAKYARSCDFMRLGLHATKIGFRHPRTNEFLEFSTPVPEEFLRYFKK